MPGPQTEKALLTVLLVKRGDDGEFQGVMISNICSM
jgi:hypothetical protein